MCSEEGNYTEPASTTGAKVTIPFLVNDELCAVANYQTGKSQTIAITYFTNLAYGLALNKIKNNTPVSQSVTEANQEISDWLGFDIITTQPADITNASSVTGQFDAPIQYGFANAGISYLMKINSNNYGNANSKLLSKKAFDDVKADGILNGRIDSSAASQLKIGTKTLLKTVYRAEFAKSILDMGNAAENVSSIKAGNVELDNFANKIKAYNVSIFSDAPPSNKAPVAVDDSKTVNVASTVIIDVLANDTDANNDSLAVELNSDPSTAATLGTVTINADNTITYQAAGTTPAGSTDTFSYFAYDGFVKSATPATVTVSIVAGTNTPPVAVDDSAQVIKGKTQLINVLANDTDADDNLLTARIIAPPGNPSNTATVTNGGINFTAGIVGQETFSYVANDGQADSNTATVTVDVTSPVNSAPVAVDDTGYSVQIGQSTIIYPLRNDTDVNGDPLTAVLATNPTLGTLAASGDKTNFTYTPGSTPGNDSFTYYAHDGIVQSAAPATVSITVTDIPNTAPVANADTANATIGDTAGVTINVLANDTDAESPTSSLQLLSFTQPTYGSTRRSGNSVIYTAPATSTQSQDSFTYIATDGSLNSSLATVTVTLAPRTNTPPVANDDTATVQIGGTQILIDVIANDSDAESPKTDLRFDNSFLIRGSVGSVGIDTTLNQISYFPPRTGTATSDTFSYRIIDPQGSTSNIATVRVTLTPAANIIPVANDDWFSTKVGATAIVLDVLANDYDSDNGPNLLTIAANSVTALAAGQGFITNNQSTLSYTPGTFEGDVLFSYKVTDGADSVAANVRIFVGPKANAAPITKPDSATVRIHDPDISIPVLANDYDPDGDVLSIIGVSRTQTGWSSKAVVNGTSIVYTPPTNGTATSDTFTYIATDGLLNSVSTTVKIVLRAAAPNTAPVGKADVYTASVGVRKTLSVLQNDFDAEGHILSIPGITTPAAGAQAGVLTNGTQIWFLATVAGTYTFSYAPFDGAATGNNV